MPRRRLLHPVVLAWYALSGVSACERSRPATHADSVAIPVEGVPPGAATAAHVSDWNRSAGPVLLVQGETRDEAIVLLPAEDDSLTGARLNALGNEGAAVTLFGRGGAMLTGHLGAPPQTTDMECRVWPLRGVTGAGSDNSWAIGFIGGETAPLPLDSVDVLSARDSMALAAEASRLASTVTVAAPPSFQGLRFTAHDIRRFEVSPGIAAIVAHLIRKVNQEANPQEEQTLLIAERDSGVTTGPYQLVYAERTHGLEEATTTPEVIGGVRVAGRPTLVVARDAEEGVAYALLERTGPRQWKIRWTSGLTRCG